MKLRGFCNDTYDLLYVNTLHYMLCFIFGFMSWITYFLGNHIDLTVKNMIKFSIPLVRLIFDQFETPRAKIGDDYLNVKLVLLKDN